MFSRPANFISNFAKKPAASSGGQGTSILFTTTQGSHRIAQDEKESRTEEIRERGVVGATYAMSLPVGVCLGDGTVILLRSQPTNSVPHQSSFSMAPIVVYDTALLWEALESFSATNNNRH